MAFRSPSRNLDSAQHGNFHTDYFCVLCIFFTLKNSPTKIWTRRQWLVYVSYSSPTKYIYITQRTTEYPLVGRGIRHHLSRNRNLVCPPPGTEGRGTLACGWGGGESEFRRLEKKLSTLCLLCLPNVWNGLLDYTVERALSFLVNFFIVKNRIQFLIAVATA